VGDKSHSRNNALHHGLAVRTGDDGNYSGDIEGLARQLAKFSNDFRRTELARTLAECHFDLQRVCAASTEVLNRIGELETAAASEHVAAAAAFEKTHATKSES
jgi:hypothetical protein